ncbi:hypothetical protein BC827DRAFT_1133985 [Russula dissimulans]|nr:hypothetical protein BC827DRAFT_1133985 [Russula dissimulans]
MLTSLSFTVLLASFVHGVAIPAIRNHWSDPYSLRPNPLYPYIRSPIARSSGNISTYASRVWKASKVSPSRTRRQNFRAGILRPRQDSSRTTEQDLDTRPTPEPTGQPSIDTTVFIRNVDDFSLLLPAIPDELVSDAEEDAKTYCTPGSSSDICQRKMNEGFITAASLVRAHDNSWIQVTGCIDSSKFHFNAHDTGGQMDVRYPNGAHCTFGGVGTSFIELVEPALNRFCLRCCSTSNDQINCNSHRDREGCENAIPGTYDFPELGVSCA